MIEYLDLLQTIPQEPVVYEASAVVGLGMLAAKAIPALFKGISGGIQARRGRKRAEEWEEKAGERPEYEMPAEFESALGVAKKRAGANAMPGQRRMEAKAQEGTQRAIGQAKELAPSAIDTLMSANQAAGQEQETMFDIGMKSSQYQDQAERDLMGAFGAMGQERKVEYEQGELAPYMDAMNMAREARGAQEAGLQNTYGAISDVATAGSQFAMMNDQNYLDMMKGVYGFSGGGGDDYLAKGRKSGGKSLDEMFEMTDGE